MNPEFDTLIRGGVCVTPGGIAEADIGIRGGRIAAIGAFSSATAAEIFDAKRLHILPGVIDTHVHFREPGLEHKEDMETGSRGALLGGVTSVFEMPNTVPPTTTRSAIDDKLSRAAGSMHCDYAFYVGATPSTIGALAELENIPGVAGVKVFMGSSTGNLLVDTDDAILGALKSGRRRLAVHAEDEARLKARSKLAIPGDPATHPIWRDEETARLATERVLHLAKNAGRRVHILHATTEAEMPLLAEARDFATVEATVQHLTLVAPECYERLGTRAQMNPPIREPRHREALWRAVAEGLIDVVGSDHAPHTLAEKSGLYPQTPSGMPGIQTLATIMLDHVHAGRLSLMRAVDLLSTGPARVFGIAGKGRIARGYDADFAIVDMNAHRMIESRNMASRCGWTPFDGKRTTGWPVATILRGRLVMRDGAIIGQHQGQRLRFADVSL